MCMKHTITFLLLLAAALSLGYYSVDIFGIFSDGDDSTAVISKTSSTPAVYLKAASGFDPMSGIEYSNAENRNRYSDEIIICSETLKSISFYNDKTAFSKADGAELKDAIMVSEDHKLFAEGYRYYNKYNELRCIDFIADVNDISFSYIRFYAPDEKVPSSENVKQKLDEINNDSIAFFNDYNNRLDKVFTSDILTDNGFREDEEYIDGAETYESRIDEINEALVHERIEYVLQQYDEAMLPADKFNQFWLRASVLCTLVFETESNAYFITGIMGVASYIIDRKILPDPVYSVYQDRIFQSFNYGSHIITVIYNVNDNYIEGYYTE